MDQSDKAANCQELKAVVLQLGFDLFRVADVTGMRGEFLLEPETRDRFGLAEIFAREVLRLLVGKGLLSPEWAERILSWPHSGFNVHSRVRAKTKPEAERVGKYMLRPVLALERLVFLGAEGKVGYRHGDDGADLERMEYLEFIARVTSHIPDKGQVMVRYFGLDANPHRGKVKKASLGPSAFRIVEEELRRLPAKGWAEMIRKVYEVDPMTCPKRGGRMTFVAAKPPPTHVFTEVALPEAEESGAYC